MTPRTHIDTLTELQEQPWLLTESYHGALLDCLENLPALDAKEYTIAAKLAYKDEDEEKGYIDLGDGLVEVPITGALLRRPSAVEQAFFGLTDTAQLRETLYNLAADQDVKGVLLNIDSQGGSVGGTPEAARAVRELNKVKPVVAYSEGMTASAAYWIGSQARLFVAEPSAKIGSIGVYVPVIDQSKRYADAGVKVELVTNSEGTYKGAGYAGTPVTDAQRANIQEQVDLIFADFKGEVLAKRPKVKDAAMRGQVFMGTQAKKQNLIDLVGDYGDAHTLLAAEVLR